MADLYQRMHGDCRSRIKQLVHPSFLHRQEIDDLLHDIYIHIVRQIQRTPLREPSRLMGFVMTVIMRSVGEHMTDGARKWQATEDLADLESESFTRKLYSRESLTSQQRDTSPLAALLEREESSEIRRSFNDSMAELKEHEREILVRFYLQQHSPEQICAEMEITPTQYRLWKSRAKAKFGNVGKKQINQRELYRLAAA